MNLYLCILYVFSFATALEQVTCAGTQKPLNAAQSALYQVAFSSFANEASDVLNYETLLGLSTVASAGADLSEFWVTLTSIQQQMANASSSIDNVKTIWNRAWGSLASAVLQEANGFLEAGDLLSAAGSFHRATTYYQLAVRFARNVTAPETLALYNTSVRSFQAAITLYPNRPFLPPCVQADVPYRDEKGNYSLHGYFCSAVPVSSTVPRPTIIALGGLDSTAEANFHHIAVPATQYGYNVLILEGPGQGLVVRTSRLPLRADSEKVVSQAVDWLLSVKGRVVDSARLVLWGSSFGGYLAARAFAHEKRLSACVADGGIYDFFQVALCKLPSAQQSLFYNNNQQFDRAISSARNTSLALDFFLSYAELALGVSRPSQVYAALQNYTLKGQMGALTSRPIFVNDPPLDAQMGNASEIFFEKLQTPFSPFTQLVQRSTMRGTGLHASTGSTNNGVEAILRWLGKVFTPPAPVAKPAAATTTTTNNNNNSTSSAPPASTTASTTASTSGKGLPPAKGPIGKVGKAKGGKD